MAEEGTDVMIHDGTIAGSKPSSVLLYPLSNVASESFSGAPLATGVGAGAAWGTGAMAGIGAGTAWKGDGAGACGAGSGSVSANGGGAAWAKGEAPKGEAGADGVSA